MEKIFLTSLLLLSFSIPSLKSQFYHPISINGHGTANILTEDHSYVGRFWGCNLELDPSVLIYFIPYNSDPSIHHFSIGLRTSISLFYYEDQNWREQKHTFGLYPLCRYNLPFRTFTELAVGPSIYLFKNIKKNQTGLNAEPFGKSIVWNVFIGIGHDFKITDRISFEPILGYEIIKAALFKEPDVNWLHGEEKYGFKILIGFQYRITNS